jgi:uncharacterized delta-60 repeat protein
MSNPSRGRCFTSSVEALECRRHLDGEYDNSFSVDGKVITSFGQPGPAEALAVAVQPNGKAVAAGFATFTAPINGSDVRVAVIARYNLDGTLDSSFEGDGQWIGPGSNNGLTQYIATGIAVQPDGKIVVLIRTTFNGVHDGGELRRFLSNGNPDPTFGNNGVAFILNDGAAAEPRSLEIDRQDRIVVAGTFESDGVVARFTSGGQPDSTFGINGRRIVSRGASSRLVLSDVDLLDNDKIVAVGGTESPHSQIVVRVTEGGNLDNDFSIGGILRRPSNFPAQFSAVAVEPGGSIWVGGYLIDNGGGQNVYVQTQRYAIDGSGLSFWEGSHSVGTGYRALQRLSGGKMLSLLPTTTLPKLRRMRVDSLGFLSTDPSFNSAGGSPGNAIVGWTNSNVDSADALAVSPTGRAYVVGSTVFTGQPRQFGVLALIGAPNQAPVIDRSSFEFESAQRLRFVFSESINPATLEAADVSVTNLDTGLPVDMANATVAYDAATRTARITPAALPDGNFRAGLLLNSIADVGGATNSESTGQFDFFVFAGDANRDRAIDIGDFAILAGRFNLSGTFSQGDFNYDGTTDIGDFAILASKFNTTLSAAARMPPAGGIHSTRLSSALHSGRPSREASSSSGSMISQILHVGRSTHRVVDREMKASSYEGQNVIDLT